MLHQTHILYAFSMILRLRQHVLVRLSIILKLMIIFLYYRPLATVFIHYRSVYLISNDLNSIKLVLTLFESCLMVNEIRILSLVVGLLLLKDSFELCSISSISLYLLL